MKSCKNCHWYELKKEVIQGNKWAKVINERNTCEKSIHDLKDLKPCKLWRETFEDVLIRYELKRQKFLWKLTKIGLVVGFVALIITFII